MSNPYRLHDKRSQTRQTRPIKKRPKGKTKRTTIKTRKRSRAQTTI